MNEMFINKNLIEKAIESIDKEKCENVVVTFVFDGAEFSVIEKDKKQIVEISQPFGTFEKDNKSYIIFR